MAPNQRAVKNHEELFPNHVSTLAVTDPELIETFDNFAFDEVLRESKLDITNAADGAVGVDDCLSGGERIPRHASARR